MTKQYAIDRLKLFPKWNQDDKWLSDGDMQELSKLAISALEKQIPKDPVDDAAFGTCPNCHSEFNSELINEYDMKYCLYCGQALKTGAEIKTEAWKEHLQKRFGRFE